MNRETVSRIGNGGGVALLAGAFFLPEPFKDWARTFLIIWAAGSIAYKSAMESKKANAQLYSKALIIAVCLGGVAMLFYGSPSVDQDGQIDDHGFDATFDQSAGAGVTAFVRLYFGAVVGIWLAGQVGRPDAPEESVSTAPGIKRTPAPPFVTLAFIATMLFTAYAIWWFLFVI